MFAPREPKSLLNGHVATHDIYFIAHVMLLYGIKPFVLLYLSRSLGDVHALD